jgi:hypothetical protein
MRMSGPPPVPKRGIRILGYMVQELLPWLKANRVIAGAELTSSQTHNGIVINYQKRPFTGTVVSGRTITVARGYVFGIRDYNDMYMDPVFTFSDPTTFTTDLDTFDANEEYEVPANEVGYVVVELRYKILAQTYGSDVDGVIWRLAGQSLGFTTNQYPGQIDDYPSDTDYKVVWVPILFIETDDDDITNFVQLTNTDIFDTFGGFLKSLEIAHPT